MCSEILLCDQNLTKYVILAQKYGLVMTSCKIRQPFDFVYDWELAIIVFITKKVRTLLTSVQIHRKMCLEKKLIISVFDIEYLLETGQLPKI